MKKSSFLIALSVVFMFSSCATLFTGTSDLISFNTDPEGAKVIIDGIEVCKTPCTANIKRKLGDKFVEFKLDGYETRLITLDSEFNPVTLLNIAIGGLIGFGIDLATGSIMKYGRRAYDIELEKKIVSLNPDKIEIDTKNKIVSIYVAE